MKRMNGRCRQRAGNPNAGNQNGESQGRAMCRLNAGHYGNGQGGGTFNEVVECGENGETGYRQQCRRRAGVTEKFGAPNAARMGGGGLCRRMRKGTQQPISQCDDLV